jgi:hypothetical protein
MKRLAGQYSRQLVYLAAGLVILFSACQFSPAAADPLQVSVYCTAGGVLQYMKTPESRQRVLRTLAPLKVSRLFLEGRRGDDHVPPDQLRELRDFFAAKGIHCSGGIATVPDTNFGKRQTGGLNWLNWESPKTRADVAGFFREDAPLFNELIVDDFFCTGDVSPEANRARGSRSWGEYRRDLLVSLIQPLMIKPARAANRRAKLIIKFPQWYDRFQMFGYDPPRMSAQCNQVWVGTEVRNPNTQRWGFVQPTEGYMNFRWLTSVAGKKVRGAWFDHIECTAQNFVDQAYGGVLAGARELTLFNLGDVMRGHPGDALLATRLPALRDLAKRLHRKARRGIAFYKPPDSDGDENLYLADYLGMIGLPVLPVARYPKDAAVVFLPVQAAADPTLFDEMQRHLNRGTTIVVTPALVRKLGVKAAQLAGVTTGSACLPARSQMFQINDKPLTLNVPVEVDSALKASGCDVEIACRMNESPLPFLTSRTVGRGQLLVLNVRTFSEQDFRDTGEWLLAPKQLGLPKIPQNLADAIRAHLLSPLHVDFHGPAGVELVLIGKEAYVYSFLDETAHIRFGNKAVDLPAHALAWLK